MSHFLDFLMKPNVEGSAMDLETIEDISDIQFNAMNPEFMTSDFFDNVMSMERANLSSNLDNDMSGLLADTDSSLTDGSYFDYLSNETQSFGDALSVTEALSHSDALSHTDGLLSPGALSVDGETINTSNEITLNPLDTLTTNNFIEVKDEYEELDTKTLQNIQEATITISANDLNTNNNIYTIIKQESPVITAQEVTNNQNNAATKVFVRHPNTKKIIVSNKQVGNQCPRNRKQVLRVQSLNGNGKSVLLPLNVKNLKKIRIVNTADMRLENLKTSPVSHSVLKKAPSEVYALSSSESVDDDLESEPTNSRYPPLSLTAEEKRLLLKEGITLPTHYPLTKNEEKDLKRIRRKIRNKISAQDSRKRKKEYVDKLEEKAKRTTEENEFLRKKIKLLHKQNSKLMDQMKKLQALLFNTSSSRATPTTCLMIVLFSTLLVCLPNMKISDKTDVGEQQLVAARRALLFKQGANEDDVNMDDFLVFNKDEEIEMESYEDDVAENENNTENGFAKFLEELSRKYEHYPDEKNCMQKNSQGSLFEFCNKYKDDLKGVIDNMKDFFEKNGTIEKIEPPPPKKFIEPDISDNEDGILVNSGQKRKLSDLTDDRLVKRGKMYMEEIHHVGPIMDDVVSTTVESKLLSSKKK